jgi:uncharacterized protein GlcG (DUF336 family)
VTGDILAFAAFNDGREQGPEARFDTDREENMLRGLAIGMIASAALSGMAIAQQAAELAPGVPAAMPFDVPYGESIGLEQAKKVAEAAAAEAKKHNWKFNIAVVGPSGDLVYFERMDGAQLASVQIAQHKARTAARYRRATIALEKGLAASPANVYLLTLDDVIASRGGNPLVVGGKLIGAIGVSGGTGSQDDMASLAGVAALK